MCYAKRKLLNRIIGLSLALIMVIMSVDVTGLVASGANDTADLVEVSDTDEAVSFVEISDISNGYIDMGFEVDSLKATSVADLNDASGLRLNGATATDITLPSSYSSVDKGYVTSVKNQLPWGTCWAFAACAAMETYALAHGMESLASDVDFSEYGLAYITYLDSMHTSTTGDYTYSTDKYVGFYQGGNNEYAFKTLSKGVGIYNESGSLYENSVNTGNVSKYVPKDSDMEYVLTGQHYISMQDTDVVKAAILEHGAVASDYYAASAYSNNNYTYSYNYKLDYSNHAITIVGWDDNKSKSLFTITDKNGKKHTPSKNGAWLVKNSWGTSFGDNGYSWISYDDVSINATNAVVYEIAPKDMYDNVYQYDGATIYYRTKAGVEFAAVYEIGNTSNQILEAVSFATRSTNVDFAVSIYKNDEENALDKGEFLTAQLGRVTSAGYYTVNLPDGVILSPGDTITIVITFSSSVRLVQECDDYEMGNEGNTFTKCSSKEGLTYRKTSTTSEFVAMDSDLCIKAFTSDTIASNMNMPIVSEVSVDNRYYNTMKVSWEPVSGYVMGYDIYACCGNEPGFTLVGSVSAGNTEFLHDVSQYQAGDVCKYAICTYFYYAGVRVQSVLYIGASSVVKEQPLDISDITWCVENVSIEGSEETKKQLVLKFKGELRDSYRLWYRLSEEDDFSETADFEPEVSAESEDEIKIYIDTELGNEFEVYITDVDENCMFNENVISLNAAYEVPKLEYIGDIRFLSGAYMKTLEADIQNEMKDFEYLYQWYVSDSMFGEATAIEGATESTYMIKANDGEKKYYYCSVSYTYGDTYVVNTTNDHGVRTMIEGMQSATISVSDIENITYTGSEVNPDITLKVGNTTLKKDVDYTISYKNNINAGTGIGDVIFCGTYVGFKTFTFKINPANSADTVASYVTSYPYVGYSIQPQPIIRFGETILNKGTDYTLSYLNNKEPGQGTIVVLYRGNFTGVQYLQFSIVSPVPSSITSSKYFINQSDKVISKISQGVTAEDFLCFLNESKYVEIRKGNECVTGEKQLATGMTANIISVGKVVASYDIVVTGDVNGDGRINITDMLSVKANLLNKSELNGAYSKAADVNGDGKINITDFLKIKAKLLGKGSICGVAAK